MGITEICTLSIEDVEFKTRFRVFDLPTYVDAGFDGIIGWKGIRNSILQLGSSATKLGFPGKVPDKAKKWKKIALVKGADTLELEGACDSGTNEIVCVDTGSQFGVALPSDRWREWKAKHPLQALTVTSFFTPADGVVVREEGWADQIHLGPLILSNVPVMEESPSEAALRTSSCAGTLGLFALRQFDLLIDGQSAVAYIGPTKTALRDYPHNRLGAAFTPDDPQREALIAHVAVGTPAQEAGIQNGDVLSTVNGRPVGKGDTDALWCFWMPAGTKLDLKLMRGGKLIEATATLRDILGPSARPRIR